MCPEGDPFLMSAGILGAKHLFLFHTQISIDLHGPGGRKGWREKSIFKIQLGGNWQNKLTSYKGEGRTEDGF